MKELRKYFEHYKFLFPHLSSFMWYLKAVKYTKPTSRNVGDGFRKLVDPTDYAASDSHQLLKWLREIARVEENTKTRG